MTNLRNSEMLRFENWLWENYNPAEVFEDWADKTTEAVMALAIAADIDPTEIVLPLSRMPSSNPYVNSTTFSALRWRCVSPARTSSVSIPVSL